MQTVVSWVNVSVNKKCLVLECSELISPTMWHLRMSLHDEGIFPSEVPSSWLSVQNLFICSLCNQLVSNSRTSSHRQHFRNRVHSMGSAAIPPNSPTPSLPSNQSLPSLDKVFQLRCPSLHFIPVSSGLPLQVFYQVPLDQLYQKILRKPG